MWKKMSFIERIKIENICCSSKSARNMTETLLKFVRISKEYNRFQKVKSHKIPIPNYITD